MKRALTVALATALAALAWAQPKVAVLDAAIPKNMDPSVIVPVTDKITEALVGSGRFTVLDRDNIDSVLKEREFQLSDMVSDQDAATAGKYLGADFVVVVKVQRLSDTYYVSGKMIAVQSGVISKQSSAHAPGDIATLIDLSEQVGSALSGNTALGQGPKELDQGGAKAPAQADKNQPAPTPAARAVKPKRTGWPIVLNLVPGFGIGSFTQGDVGGGLAGVGLSAAFWITGSLPASEGTIILFSAVAVGEIVYAIARPIGYARQWNRAHNVGSIEFLPTLVASTDASGEISTAPGAVLKLSY